MWNNFTWIWYRVHMLVFSQQSRCRRLCRPWDSTTNAEWEVEFKQRSRGDVRDNIYRTLRSHIEFLSGHWGSQAYQWEIENSSIKYLPLRSRERSGDVSKSGINVVDPWAQGIWKSKGKMCWGVIEKWDNKVARTSSNHSSVGSPFRPWAWISGISSASTSFFFEVRLEDLPNVAFRLFFGGWLSSNSAAPHATGESAVVAFVPSNVEVLVDLVLRPQGADIPV